MKTYGIVTTLPAQDLVRARAFYSGRVGLQVVESKSLEARDGRVGLIVGDGDNQLFLFPAQVRHPGDDDGGQHRANPRRRRGSVVQGLRRQPDRARPRIRVVRFTVHWTSTRTSSRSRTDPGAVVPGMLRATSS